MAGNLPGAIAAITALVTILPLMKGAASLRTTQAVFVGGCAAVMSVWSWLVFTGATAATRASERPPAAATPAAAALAQTSQSGSCRNTPSHPCPGKPNAREHTGNAETRITRLVWEREL